MRRIVAKVASKVGASPYDEEDPSTWTVRQLLEYVHRHKITVTAVGMQKEELVRLVVAHKELQRGFIASLEPMPPLVTDVVDIRARSGGELLGYAALPPYAATLRQHPDLLRDILAAGLEQVRDPTVVMRAMMCKRELAVVSWLLTAAGARDGEASEAPLGAVLAASGTSSVCGKYFSRREMVVRCLDCGADPTCVMCMECFQCSPCRHHRYQVTPGSGGGMCDCGDPTAWKPESFCSRHRGAQDGADPTASLAPADNEWATTVLRGAVQFVTLALQQLDALGQPRATDATNEEGAADTGDNSSGRAHSSSTHEDVVAETVHRARHDALVDRGWPGVCIDPVARMLEALHGDCARRLLSQLWVEPPPLRGGKESTCLEVVFRAQLRRDEQTRQTEKHDDAWWSSLVQSIGNCLSDSVFRVPFAAVYMTYAERLGLCRARLVGFSVQFMTSPDTVQRLLMTVPSLLPYASPRDTVLHRGMSALVYFAATSMYDDTPEKRRPLPDGCPPWLFRIRWHTPGATYAVGTMLTYAVAACREAALVSVLSRSLARAWYGWLLVLQASADIRHGAQLAVEQPCDAQWLLSCGGRVMWKMQSALLGLLRALQAADRQGGGGAPHASPRQCLQRCVPEALLEVISGSTTFDPAPDPGAVSARHAAFMRGQSAMLAGGSSAHCRSAGGEEEEGQQREGGAVAGEGKESACAAALILPDLTCTTAAAAMYQRQQEEEEEDGVPSTRSDLCFVKSYLAEAVRAVDVSMLVQCLDFQRLSRDSVSALCEVKGAGSGTDEATPPASRFSPPRIVNSSIVLRRSRAPVYAYDLSEPVAHSTSFANGALRMLALILHAWVMCQKHAASTPHHSAAQVRFFGQASASALSHALEGEGRAPPPPVSQPLREITASILDDRPSPSSSAAAERVLLRRESMLDALVMPFVLLAQTQRGWWARGDCNVQLLTELYFVASPSLTLQQDIYLLQVLSMHMPPQDYALRLLQRFSCSRGRSGTVDRTSAREDGQADGSSSSSAPAPYGEDDESTLRSGAAPPPCLAGYFRLMLTVITDTCKANTENTSEFSLKVIKRHIAHSLALKHARHSELLSETLTMFRGIDADGDEADEDGNNLQHTTQLAIDAVAVGVDTHQGKTFRLRDTATWRALVDVYHPSTVDEEMETLHSNYSRLVIAERLAAAPPARESSAAPAAPSAASSPPPPRLPPARLRTDEQYRELVPCLRALLHTDALLVPAMQELLRCMCNRTDTQGPSTEVAAPASGSAEPQAAEEPVDKYLLIHAVTVLYLCVQDCAAISAAVDEQTGVAQSLSESPSAAPTSCEVEIDWGHVESYLAEHVPQTCTFTKDSVRRWIYLRELTGSQSVKAKLARRVPVSRLVATAAPSADAASAPSVSVSEVLHKLRAYFLQNPREDKYSLTAMIEYILLATGLALFQTEPSTEEAAAAAEAEEAAKSRQRSIKEKQAKLLAQLRSRGVKKSSAVAGVGPVGAAAASAGEGSAALASVSNVTVSAAQLHARLLLELTALECCVCRDSTEEPLLLLAHTSSSGVLGVLQPGSLPDGRAVHSHVHLCGHAAHKSCTEKLFARLAQLWQRGYFQGQSYLGPAEFSCPVCMAICTALCPLPVLSSSGAAEAAGGGASTGAVTLFEEIRRSTLGAHPHVIEAACEDMHNALAQACIGLSANEDGRPVVEKEDALQHSGSKAWQLSETLRTIHYHLRLMLISVRADIGGSSSSSSGGDDASPIIRDCLTLLTLLVSVTADSLRRFSDKVETHLQRTHEDFCTLLLNVLRDPRTAAFRIASYAVALKCSSPAAAGILNATGSEQATEVANDARSSNNGSGGVGDDAGDDGASAGAVLGALWAELGSLVLLKLLICDGDADGNPTSSSAMARVLCAGTASSGAGQESRGSREGEPSSQQQQQQVSFPTLRREALATPSSARAAVQDMWVFLTSGYVGSGLSSPASRAVPLAPLLPPSLSTTALQWREAVLENVLHLPREYMDVLSRQLRDTDGCCAHCHRRSEKPVMCCYCGAHLCLQPEGRPPELFAHARRCGGGLGLFVICKATSIVVLDTVTGRILEHSSVYTDAYGETDQGLLRGGRLTRDATASDRLLATWLRNRWGVESALLKRTWRHGAKSL